ncbi:ryncolin-1 [Aplysia californica]|uniref:Ryncolin-1 n=1 Tax=Aplysia californica TaxID=6500 RepID=A0ABM0JR87_APLCA|nr:ryncolin-1 [Aplysia californica]
MVTAKIKATLAANIIVVAISLDTVSVIDFIALIVMIIIINNIITVSWIKGLREEALANDSRRIGMIGEYLETQLYPNLLTFLDGKGRQRQENWGPKDCESVSTARRNQDQYKVVTWTYGKRRRVNGRVDFERSWADYRMGFGDPHGDYWLGLDDMADLTRHRDQDLRIDFLFKGKNYTFPYLPFRVAPLQDNFRLDMGSYITDEFYRVHNGAVFSTWDNDKSGGCSKKTYKTGWWFVRCHQVYHNGVWRSTEWAKMIVWASVTGNYEGADFVSMKIRRHANK